MIYLIADVEKRWCKIGYSVNPSDRIKGIQTGIPFLLEVLYVIEGNYKYEKYLHKKFKEYYIRGEWFNYHTDIVNYIASKGQLPINSKQKSEKIEYTIKESDVAVVKSYIEKNMAIDHDIAIMTYNINKINQTVNKTNRYIKKIINKLIEEEYLVKIGKCTYTVNTGKELEEFEEFNNVKVKR